MAEKKPEAEAPAPEGAPEKKKGLPIKTIAVIAVIMIVEAAAVFFVFGMLAKPKESHAEAPKTLEHDESNEIQEIEIANDKFQNLSTGRVWIWDISLFVQVKNKNAERIEKLLEQRKAEMQEGIGQIISRAQHAQLKEPDRQSLNRQLSGYLLKIIGSDTEGKAYFERVLIPKCRGYPTDS